jgi:phenylalanyl-tRNA synthetase beta chain
MPFKKAAAFHPQKSALIYAGSEQIGIIGYLHPSVIENFDLSPFSVAYELNFDLLAELASESIKFDPISSFPEVNRDLSFWLDEKIEVQEIINKINDLNIDYLKTTRIIDIYKDKNKEGQKSVTLEITLQSMEHTLSEQEISDAIDQIEKLLSQTFKATLREGK